MSEYFLVAFAAHPGNSPGIAAWCPAKWSEYSRQEKHTPRGHTKGGYDVQYRGFRLAAKMSVLREQDAVKHPTVQPLAGETYQAQNVNGAKIKKSQPREFTNTLSSHHCWHTGGPYN